MIKRALVAVFVLTAAAVAYYELKYPVTAPPRDLKIEATPERLSRGRYLFHHVTLCADCHSKVDWQRFGFPVQEGGLAAGRAWPKEVGLPGEVYSPNITPDKETGVGAWTDGELVRAIREGIGRDGRALFPLMLYTEFRNLSDEDVYSIVAYLRTIPPVRSEVPRTRLEFPLSQLIKMSPEPVASVSAPDRADPVSYGRYLATVAGCKSCHTPAKDGAPIPGMEFAGGEKFGTEESGMVAYSYNLTPDNNTGIGTWNEEQFLDKFRQYRAYAAGSPPALTPENFTAMPWLYFAAMDEADLKAIFAYLKTVKPVEHAVETRPLAAKNP